MLDSVPHGRSSSCHTSSNPASCIGCRPISVPAWGRARGPDGRRYDCRDGPKVTAVAVNFLTHPEQLAALLPQRFEVGPQPIVTVYATYMKQIEWLAGRGYNTLGVTFPAVFQGDVDRAEGQFLAVLWENLADPIISGREELGFSKVYCELPEPNVLVGGMKCQASWLGFTFLDLKVQNLTPQSRDQIDDFVAGQTGDGRLHYQIYSQDWPVGRGRCSLRRAHARGHSRTRSSKSARWARAPFVFIRRPGSSCRRSSTSSTRWARWRSRNISARA